MELFIGVNLGYVNEDRDGIYGGGVSIDAGLENSQVLLCAFVWDGCI